MLKRAHSPPFKGGVAAQRPGWLVISNKIRSATRAYKEATRPFTNHPVCAVKERDLFVSGAATSPLKGGEWTRLATKPFPLRSAFETEGNDLGPQNRQNVSFPVSTSTRAELLA